MRSNDRYLLDDVSCAVGGMSLPVANLSVGGFFVACQAPLPEGQSIAFDLVFPDGWRLSAVGRVAWVNASEAGRADGLPRGCGITITQVAFPDKLALVARLRRAAGEIVPRFRPGHEGAGGA